MDSREEQAQRSFSSAIIRSNATTAGHTNSSEDATILERAHVSIRRILRGSGKKMKYNTGSDDILQSVHAVKKSQLHENQLDAIFCYSQSFASGGYKNSP